MYNKLQSSGIQIPENRLHPEVKVFSLINLLSFEKVP
jgi:hypothetical protein